MRTRIQFKIVTNSTHNHHVFSDAIFVDLDHKLIADDNDRRFDHIRPADHPLDVSETVL